MVFQSPVGGRQKGLGSVVRMPTCGAILRIAELLALLLTFLPVPKGRAQPFFTSTQWQVTSGLPSEVVQAIAQTPDHYLWVGTTAGLLRFDGSAFVLYTHQNTAELTSDNIECLLGSTDGSLWIGTESGGVVRYRAGQFKRFSAKEGITNDFILSLFEDREHTLWVGTDRGVFASAGDRFRHVGQEAGVPNTTAYAIFQDAHGAMWIGGTTLRRITGSTVQEFHLNGKIGTPHVRSIVESENGLIWVATNLGLYRSTEGGTFKQVSEVRANARVLRRASDGTIWIGTVGDGMYELRPGSNTAERFPQAFVNTVILGIDEDAQGNLWVGTRAGLVRLSRTPVNLIPVANATNSDFGSMMRDSDGSIWMCSTQTFRGRNGAFERYEIAALRGMIIRTLTRDRDGSLWAGTEGNGLLHLSRSGIVLENYSHKLVSNDIRAVLQAKDGSVWVGTDSGVSHITHSDVWNQRSVNGHSAYVMSILEDRSGDIWVGTYYGLLHLHRGVPVEDEITGAMRQVNIWSLHESSDRTFWIGTNDGLYVIRGSSLRHFSRDQGLPGSPIYQILEDPDGRMWLSSPSGISVFYRDAFYSMGTGNKEQLPLTYFPISEDFAPAELFGSVRSAGIMTPQGDVWFPSTRGALHIVPSSPAPDRPFPLRITRFLVDGRPVALDRAVVLPAASAALAIDYSPILLSSQSGVRFRFKLEGFDGEWQEVSTRRTAYYTNLPQGHFRFRVEAYRTGSSTEVQEATISFVKLAPLYRRPWFISLCVLLAFAGGVGAYQLRLRRLHSRFRFVLEERNRVAREMHDTVIQGCTTISALLEAASGMRGTNEDSARKMDQLARRQIQTTIIEARQAVWNLRHGVPLEDDIEAAMAKIAEDAGQESAAKVMFSRSGSPLSVAPAVSHELLMTTREAVRNALTHGRPRSVCIEMSFEGKGVSVIVRDDGKGFNTNTRSDAEATHFGLQGMQERIRRVGGELRIDSVEGEGTSVTIKVGATVSRSDRVVEEA